MPQQIQFLVYVLLTPLQHTFSIYSLAGFASFLSFRSYNDLLVSTSCTNRILLNLSHQHGLVTDLLLFLAS